METKTLEIGKDYFFRVKARIGNDVYAAELSLKPSQIVFKVRGDLSIGQKNPFEWQNHDSLVCRNGNETYILHTLKFRSSFDQVLDRQKNKAHFESEYEVGYVLFCPTPISQAEGFWRIDIYSPTLTLWVGHTTKQDEIIQCYSERNQRENLFEQEFLTEILIELNGQSFFGASYHPKMFYSPDKFKAGIEFPLSVFLENQSTVKASEWIEDLHETIALLDFCTGGEISVDKILLTGEEASGSLYYPTRGMERGRSVPILFPLGHNLRFDFGLPSLPFKAIQQYFTLEVHRKQFFSRYIQYRRFSNPEERFLGYFRLLETLTANKSDKVGKRLCDFFDILPVEVTRKWKYDKATISVVCRLRNDLTHANPHSHTTEGIGALATFVEALLIFALFREITVSPEVVAKAIPRMNGYHFILEPPVFQTVELEDS